MKTKSLKKLGWIAALLSLMLVLTACNGNPLFNNDPTATPAQAATPTGTAQTTAATAGTGSPVTTELGQNFSLKIGQTARFASENLTVQVAGLVQDGRCAANVECAGAGPVILDLAITKDGGPLTHVQFSQLDSLNKTTFLNYKVALNGVSPDKHMSGFGTDKQTVSTIAMADYVFTLQVTKVAAGPNPTAAPATTQPAKPTAPAVTPVGPTSLVPAQLGQEFRLKFGQTARFASEGLSIQPDHVVEDSRCPANVNCVWAGQLILDLVVTKDGGATTHIQISTLDAYRTPTKAVFEGYSLNLLGVEPGRNSQKTGDKFEIPTIGPDGYVFKLRLTKVATSPNPTVNGTLGQRVTLAFGQTASFNAEGLTVKFDSVPQDIRCPISNYVMCSNSGQATVTFLATKGSQSANLTVIMTGMVEDTTKPDLDKDVAAKASADFAGYHIQLVNLSPMQAALPTPTGKLAIEVYTATLLVTKQ